MIPDVRLHPLRGSANAREFSFRNSHKDYAPCSISAFGLFAISEFNCMRSCALFAQAAISCQVCVAAARKSSSAASTAAGDPLAPAPLLLLVMELIKVLW